VLGGFSFERQMPKNAHDFRWILNRRKAAELLLAQDALSHDEIATLTIVIPFGVVGDEGSTNIVVTNGLRLLRTQE
jgi:hypothetical protein